MKRLAVCLTVLLACACSDDSAQPVVGSDLIPSGELALTPTTPEIVEFGWSSPGPTAGDPPLPGDPLTFFCRVRDLDEDAVTVTIELSDLDGDCTTANHCWVDSRTFARGEAATSQCQGCAVGVSVQRTFDAPDPRFTVRFTCSAIDEDGRRSDESTTCFSIVGPSGCP